jgi:molybdopterin molybdotransferase
MKDGFAIRAADTRNATDKVPADLDICGMLGAGEETDIIVRPGTTVRVLTGARIPAGADSVIAEEFVTISSSSVRILEPEAVGRNILLKGSDVTRGDLVVAAGTFLKPGKIGLLAAGGIANLQVICRPAVALIASGDEIMLPGSVPCDGKIYASNLLTLNGWCRRYGLVTEVFHVPDDQNRLKEIIKHALEDNDVLVTSGGAWTGDRDLMARALDDLGWEKSYHRVRLGPGKAVGFGLLNGKPVFMLPGGPPSNLVAFLQVVLPALKKLCGHSDIFLPRVQAYLDRTVEGQSDWTQAIFGCLKRKNGKTVFFQTENISRLKNIAAAEAILLIPEGITVLDKGAMVSVQLLE